jgi:hypothetical protein
MRLLVLLLALLTAPAMAALPFAPRFIVEVDPQDVGVVELARVRCVRSDGDELFWEAPPDAQGVADIPTPFGEVAPGSYRCMAYAVAVVDGVEYPSDPSQVQSIIVRGIPRAPILRVQ